MLWVPHSWRSSCSSRRRQWPLIPSLRRQRCCKLSMATPSTSATTFAVASEYESWASTHRKRRNPISPSAAGGQKQPCSHSRPCSANVLQSRQTRHKIETDRFGRTLAYLVRADGWDYSVEAARAGTAHSYVYGGRPTARHDAIAAAEREAMDARRGLWGPPCNGNTASTVTTQTAAAPPPAVLPLVPPAAMPPPTASSAYYGDCGDARAAGAAPLHAGEPGYRSDLDRDGDGVACEN